MTNHVSLTVFVVGGKLDGSGDVYHGTSCDEKLGGCIRLALDDVEITFHCDSERDADNLLSEVERAARQLKRRIADRRSNLNHGGVAMPATRTESKYSATPEYRNGYEAAVSGAEMRDCHYQPGSMKRLRWVCGFCDARDDLRLQRMDNR